MWLKAKKAVYVARDTEYKVNVCPGAGKFDASDKPGWEEALCLC